MFVCLLFFHKILIELVNQQTQTETYTLEVYIGWINDTSVILSGHSAASLSLAVLWHLTILVYICFKDSERLQKALRKCKFIKSVRSYLSFFPFWLWYRDFWNDCIPIGTMDPSRVIDYPWFIIICWDRLLFLVYQGKSSAFFGLLFKNQSIVTGVRFWSLFAFVIGTNGP